MKRFKELKAKKTLIKADTSEKMINSDYQDTSKKLAALPEERVKNFPERLKLERLDYRKLEINDSLTALIPEVLARKHVAIAVSLEEHKLKVAMKDPFDLLAIEDLKVAAQKEIEPIIATEQEILDLINEAYTVLTTKHLKNQIENQLKRVDFNRQENIQDEANKAPVVQLINHILDSCISKGASDIHIEPMKEEIRVRYRLDGELQEFMRIQRETLDRIVTRIRILAGLDITERRVPQDGRLSREIKGHAVDLRINLLPTVYGEKIVIRIMDQSSKICELNEIGFYPTDYEKVKEMMRISHGMIMIVGPTGSGKSTTLSALVKSRNTENINIVTVEDPVEKLIDGVNQVNINKKTGLGFPNILRAVLRQDPDIIVVGEIRDSETSEVAVSAALTGHLVMTTLHTNDAVSSISRMIDMGIEAFKVADAVKGIISQRLVRKLCERCKEKHITDEYEEKAFKIPGGTVVYRAKGCTLCHFTGYKGRVAVHEVLIIDAYLARLIASGRVSNEVIQEEAEKRGMRTLMTNSLELVRQGKTTIEEMMRRTYEW